jgi:hypothetical protein
MGVDRFGALLYGIGEAAGYLAVPPSTLTTWAYGYERRRAGARDASARPIVTAVRPERPGEPVVPFIGLAEAYALASRRLYTDGAEVLYDYARHAGDTPSSRLGSSSTAASAARRYPRRSAPTAGT